MLFISIAPKVRQEMVDGRVPVQRVKHTARIPPEVLNVHGRSSRGMFGAGVRQMDVHGEHLGFWVCIV